MTDPETPSRVPKHNVLGTPRGQSDDFAENPYDYLPKAPPRVRAESSDSDSEFDFQVCNANNPMSDRIFLDLDFCSNKKMKTHHDGFLPIAPTPALQPRNSSRRRRRRPRPVTPNNNEGFEVSKEDTEVSSSSKEPQLCVPWIEKRSNEPLVFRAGLGNKPFVVPRS
mmetsp:Transcript_22532/g.55837  ORF Transcript_22532/g.55837 Transcript_22532/m.55837 type:complete len:167 (-) Transcript_22532:242-742(-)|eukprot:CAMPEP_0116103300 /NCGR_PEP_ID=MMETSP0327-20121206/13809_1 /TAXON_ID=44447 /ORGANISM="Pseudo-nitzschia delicatissima, Strain B596" /LENGTH=166 /DNA_ID=CAMNT_0003595397 /DNA_START=169 /DNA_END=669 /DNA_ORIENTATION=-